MRVRIVQVRFLWISTYTLIKEALDNSGIHLFVLVHLSDLGLHDIVCEALD